MGQGSCESFADWMRHSYWLEGRVRQIPSPFAVGGETGYTAQEDLKSVNSHNMGEGRTIRVWFFCSCLPRPSLVLSAFCLWATIECTHFNYFKTFHVALQRGYSSLV